MSEVASQECVVRRGFHGSYHWLTATGGVYIGTLLASCPGVVLDRYLAVTQHDSGVLRLSDDEIAMGWSTKGGVAYSPLVTSIERLRFQRDGVDAPGYDEWYVFKERREIGDIFDGDYFKFEPGFGRILAFASMAAFVLHDPEPYLPRIMDRFWNQLERLAPETFIADGLYCLTVVSTDVDLIAAIENRFIALQ